MDKLEMLTNLMIMAATDGRLTGQEVNFLTDRSVRWGIDEDEFRKALDAATDHGRRLTIPETAEERRWMLSELVRMMAADGQLDEREKQLFALAAARMEISDRELNDIIDNLTS